MTIKILTTLAAAAMLVACGDDSTTTPPSKAQQCSAGLSADCLMGTWSINGPTITRAVGEDVVHIIDPSHDLTASPATLKFYVDAKNVNKFEFVNSSLSKADCITGTGKTYGDWSIAGTSLTLVAKIGNECMEKSSITVTPSIVVSGNDVTLTLPSIFFMEPEMKQADAVDKQGTSEIYKFETAN